MSRPSLASGDLVRLAVHEGPLRAGMTGVVVEAFRKCDLVMVTFGRTTRVVRSTAVEAVHASGAVGDESTEACG